MDALAAVPDAVLAEQVAERGLCLWEITYGDPPLWDGEGPPDRELAARLCAGCPVRRECLEFELRLGGAETVGVWGGLDEDDRRALHALWRARAGRFPRRVRTREQGEPERTDADRPELVRYGGAAVVLVAALWLAWRLLLTAAGIVGAQWLVIHYAAGNLTLLLTALGLPALFAAHVLTQALTGTAVRRRGGRRR